MDEPALDRMQKRLAFNAENAEIENNPSRARHYREILEALAGLRAERDAARALARGEIAIVDAAKGVMTDGR